MIEISALLMLAVLVNTSIMTQAATIPYNITIDASASGANHDPYSYKEAKSDGENFWYITTTYSPNGFGYFHARSEDTVGGRVSPYRKIQLKPYKAYGAAGYGFVAKAGRKFRMYSKKGASDYYLTKSQGRYCP